MKSSTEGFGRAWRAKGDARSRSVAFRCAVALAGLLVSLAGIGCDRGEPEVLEAGRAVLASVPDFKLTNQSGKSFGSADLREKVWIADFVFTRCATMCPRLSAEMADLQKALAGDPEWDQIRLVSISVDPEYDTPEVLARYATKHGADAEHWAFLTGDRDTIWELSQAGFKLPVGERPVGSDDPLFHSSKFVLVDRDGRIRGYYDALEAQGRADLQRDLRAVLAEAGVDRPAATDQSKPGGAELVQSLSAPPNVERIPWLAARTKAQREAWEGSATFHDFSFIDRRPESGVTFKHRATSDSGKDWIPVHYDHGNSVSIADVDGDGLSDVFWTTQLGNNGLWKNLGDGKFKDITWQALSGGLFDRVSVAGSFADTDNDGDVDLLVTAVRGGNTFYENDGKGVFKDATADSGLGYKGHSSAAVFFDYDRDGLLDLFLLNIGKYTTEVRSPEGRYVGMKDAFAGHLKPERFEQSILYQNRGDNRFVDVSEEVGLQDLSWSGDAIPVDFNDDGWIDLYLANMQGLDEYYENVEGKRFEKKSRELFPRTSWGAMGVKAFDYDNDGDLDLYITDMHSDMPLSVVDDEMSELWLEREKSKFELPYPPTFLLDDGKGIGGNTFFRNDGNGVFVEISDEIGAENFWPWGLSVGDLNADGFEDVFVASSMNYPWRYGMNSVLLNVEGNRFADAELVVGVEPRRDGRVVGPWFVLDCAGEDQHHGRCPKGGAGRVVVNAALGSRSSVIFDLDEDGDLDIVTNDFNSEPMILISDLSERKKVHRLQVKLIGDRSNRDGLGAKVSVVAGGQRYTKVHDGQSGYLAQSVQPLYFGLGDAEQVDEILIRWPSGLEQRVEGPIPLDSTFEIREGS